MTGVTTMNEGTIPKTVKVVAAKEDGTSVEFDAVVHIDTPGEAEYFRNGETMPASTHALRSSPPPDTQAAGSTNASPDAAALWVGASWRPELAVPLRSRDAPLRRPVSRAMHTAAEHHESPVKNAQM